jgi:hypothetical protein
MFIVKYDFLNFLKIPIYTILLGENKTWRGLIFLPIVNSIILGVVNYFLNLNILNPFTLGLILGIAYILFEFPNSLIKRKLGIKQGENHTQYKLIFQLFDKMDSAFGVCLVYYLLGFVAFHTALLLFALSSLTHIIISKLLLTLKLKKNF